jgi:ATP-dependent protease HslVU (ClpYQ) peptidase subunit
MEAYCFMSIVIGLRKAQGNVLLGCDSLVTSGNGGRTGAHPKILRKVIKHSRGWIEAGIGSVGPPAMFSMMRWGSGFELPDYQSPYFADDNLDQYVYGSLVQFLADKQNERLSQWGLDAPSFGAIVTICGLMWSIDCEYNAIRFTDTYDAVGSGADYAIGALDAMYEHGDLGEDELRHAIEIAIDRDITCGGPVWVMGFDQDVIARGKAH